MKRRLFSLIAISALVLPSCSSETVVSPVDLSEKINKANQALDNAEAKVLGNTPDDTDPKPNEDPAKCPCKGTGSITHGDGHKTPCPFHSGGAVEQSKSEPEEEKPPVEKITQTPHPDPDVCDCDGIGVLIVDGEKDMCPFHAEKHDLIIQSH
jgi:hypothetical protein